MSEGLCGDVGGTITPPAYTLNVTENGTYPASQYSQVVVNVGGGGTTELKIGAIRPDAVLDQSWTYDKMIVQNEHKTIPAYSTSLVTLKAGESEPQNTLDGANYDYILVERYLAIPSYSSAAKDLGREVYWASSSVCEIVCTPGSELHDGGTYVSSDKWTLLSTTYSMYVYWGSPSILSSAVQTIGAHLARSVPTIGSTGVLTVKSPGLCLKGSSVYFTQTYWELLTDVRYQYVIELWKAPKNHLNIDGYEQESNFGHIISCYNNGGTLS